MKKLIKQDRDYVKETIKVPGYYHRTLYGSKHVILRDIEKKTGTQIRFPPREDGRDEVVIYGPKGQLSSAGAMLLVRQSLCSAVYGRLAWMIADVV